MIYIKKQTADPNISVYKKKRWKGPNGKRMTLAQRDLMKAIAHYGDKSKFNNNTKKTSEKAVKFEAYSHEETKEELKKIFNGKCAYCESQVTHIEPGDVEHFRPKAKIIDSNGIALIPGYYWLGADWNNLLLSCTKCNRSNKERINDGTLKVTMGKANDFPLSDEQFRVRHHKDSLRKETPHVLLINPCTEKPSKYLDFKDDGQVEAKDQKGKKSIEIYGLYRANLVYKRRKTADKLYRTIRLLVLELRDMEQKLSNGQSISISLEKLKIYREELSVTFDKEAEFLALKRQIIERFVQKNPIANGKLTDYNINLMALV